MEESGNIHRVLNDVDCYGNFFTGNYHTACLVASRYIRDNQEIEDIVQEVFIKIWEKRKEIKVQSSLKNYLLNSVKNTCINRIQRKKEIIAGFDQSDIPQWENETGDQFISEEFASKINQAIETLPPQCKKIFLSIFIDELTYQETADALGLSKNTVKTQMGIAYRLLREKLHDSFFNMVFILFKKG
ncbi:MAG: RNA polymerase sigma-70 factor [Prolixibacteraceae bacterium]|jgi:RNA polymerase sigma-70 factor (ECF subfamily)|nr:RNA polymerase sigma-70 factor [Prolixibacteraceae bacterium]